MKIQFIHITDTHLNAPGREFLKVSMADKLKQIFEHVRMSKLAPAFVVITGDLAHEGIAEDYQYIRKLVNEGSDIVGAPVHVTLGNHDHRSAFREGYLGEEPSEQAYYYSTTINGLRLIALNSQVPGKHSGTVDEEQLAWLAEELTSSAPNGTIVALHHPLLNFSGMPSEHIITNAPAIGDILKTGDDVVCIVAGHVHTNNVGLYEGIVSVAAAGSAFAGESTEDGQFRMYDFCSYNIVTVSNKNVTVQTVVLPTTNVEYARFDMSILTTQH
ncbi:metallophosphoesterase [Paenibacillus filicis]|uniref:Metallophosphoesterase n=1 Tax=Paenibacillus gyeongsangnamensis TaxID=3388067 RepID=A0ABT4QF63_9BACL|nr:metallophosphoesterase [Paenibacillus filicis]MCZ8515495.1 metallophosphoesterase [Paenibacillus filicis]